MIRVPDKNTARLHSGAQGNVYRVRLKSLESFIQDDQPGAGSVAQWLEGVLSRQGALDWFPQHHNLERDAQAVLKRNLSACQPVGSSRICPLLSGALLSYLSLMLSLTNNVYCVCTAAVNKSSGKEAAPAKAFVKS